MRDGDGLRWGVESICAQLTELGAKIAPATYYEHRSRKPTVREQRDEELKPRIAAPPAPFVTSTPVGAAETVSAATAPDGAEGA